MRYGPDDKFWIVVDPQPTSELADIMFEASVRDLDRQFKGGLTLDENPTLFTDPSDAQSEAISRMVALKVSQTVLQERGKAKLEEASRIELHAADGTVIFGADLPDGR